MKNSLKLIRLVQGIRLLVAATLALSLVSGLTSVARPYLFKQIVDLVTAGVHSRAFAGIGLALLGLLGLSVVSGVIEYFSDIVGDRLLYRAHASLRKRVFSRLVTLSIDFYETHRTGELINRVINGLSELTRFIYQLAYSVTGQIAVFVFSLGAIWLKTPWAGLIATLIIPINLALRIRMIRQNRTNRREAREHDDEATGHLSETLGQMATVRSFGGEKEAETSYGRAIDSFVTTRLKVTYSIARIDFLISFLSNGLIVASIGIVAYLAVHGHATAGDVVLVALLLQQINGSLSPLTRFLVNASEVEATSERIVELLEERPSVADRPGASELSGFETLQFKNVSFRYPGKRTWVLRNVSFTLKKGETLALVGPSGVGKSTITKLILRFYDVTEGSILINSRDIRDYTQDSVRGLMAMVMQDVALFNDTIEQNLQFARPDATRAEVRQAAERAHATEFIDQLPERYQTLVGERGIKLSGGQKQRVAIARAILKDPNLIILDEATSALDSESEKLVKEGMADLLKDRTAVIIAHRLSTVMEADQIVVLRSGKVIERGDHKSLIKKEKGLYARLFKLQSI